MDSTNELKIISLCSGSLGIERGIARSGTKVRSVVHVEREAFVCFNLVKQMEQGMVDVAPIWTDVKTFGAKPFRNRIHGIVGGYPCQGESNAGKRETYDYEGFLWPNIEQQIIDSNPLFCFFENVGSHLTGTFPYILSRLRHLGYSVEVGLFTAAETGAPHERQRVFIFAWSDTGELRRCLANSSSQQGRVPEVARGKGPIAVGHCGEVLADADGIGCKRNHERKGACGTNKQTCRVKSSRESAATAVLPNTFSKRGRKSNGQYSSGESYQDGSQWPAPPGRRQKAFEEPRVTGGAKTESGMGCSINGYDYRRDILRMLGNGVVEQASALAWRSLTAKALNTEP